MKRVLISLALLTFAVFTFAPRASACTYVTVCKNGKQSSIDILLLPKYLKKGYTQGACPAPKPVPEFGDIPGAIALISSGVTFLFLKKKI